ncbi:hypothetical protein [Pseudonocardia kunmingensis]|uniref:Uncharacterized protein n=1 Tax=Pseudonocardia kunmingensis TaxID=630975 RepID=A0A543DZ14_9PSEU|nr:hypothetical protein [Pseudonocardia kunmingensis]TQM14577.1 hypothetical protein FB558_1343 [Pseudonocardia kunmingensis]
MRPDPRATHGAAFAHGRRLREMAQHRRAHREAHHARIEAHRARIAGHRARRFAGRRHRRHSPGWVLLALLLASAAAGTVALIVVSIFAAAVAVTAMALPALLVGGTAIALARHGRRRALAAGTVPLPARPAAPPRPEAVWERARDRFAALRGEYAAFECDPMQVLHRPALADVSVPSTARFVDAFAEAQALATDAYPPGEHGASFVSAVDRAERAWRAAVEAADRIRLSGLSPAERGTVERVIKLLTTARDSDNDPERLAAYSLARAELTKLDRAGVVHLPRTAAAALDEAARGALPA